ncbi:uncharacterized protein I303_102360 [Kwoniella dejecticola CBS 10117]|uniref:Uncharacterized protein n=1 Tax=Kwoniella dejecticola CBS 10117 TaxID=1296121 RepID=A0A1A6AB73_9TREE|nr:uncharacterized protein I303_01500 [Kwoniella dejecticola CBS 10117]OBR87298.1 hypothetical protein I303_01500 [Kwoniella dejecticola CBS 10117]
MSTTIDDDLRKVRSSSGVSKRRYDAPAQGHNPASCQSTADRLERLFDGLGLAKSAAEAITEEEWQGFGYQLSPDIKHFFDSAATSDANWKGSTPHECSDTVQEEEVFEHDSFRDWSSTHHLAVDAIHSFSFHPDVQGSKYSALDVNMVNKAQQITNLASSNHQRGAVDMQNWSSGLFMSDFDLELPDARVEERSDAFKEGMTASPFQDRTSHRYGLTQAQISDVSLLRGLLSAKVDDELARTFLVPSVDKERWEEETNKNTRETIVGHAKDRFRDFSETLCRFERDSGRVARKPWK